MVPRLKLSGNVGLVLSGGFGVTERYHHAVEQIPTLVAALSATSKA
jgi:hypothetical protein